MKLLDILNNDIRHKDNVIYNNIYLYTNYQKSHNTITIIISPIKLTNKNYNLEGIYEDCTITNLTMQNTIHLLVSECYARHIRIKIVFNELC